jgi:hypothetical protein
MKKRLTLVTFFTIMLSSVVWGQEKAITSSEFEFSMLFPNDLVSVFFIYGAIIPIFILSSGYVTTFLWYSKSRVNFFLDLLKGIEKKNLAEKQRDINNTARLKTLELNLFWKTFVKIFLLLSLKKNENHKNDEKVLGAIWGEFDETLILSQDGTKLSNTFDASYFFNPTTLAKEILENRLIVAIPSFLTAIGVIGTFLGLLLGLRHINITSDVDVKELQQGIMHMISGASIAFITSVWGVSSSLVFNIGEKFCERIIQRDISNLQNRIDFLYPRINAEQSLVEISDHGENSLKTLNGLAEKIGNKMQEAMVKTTEEIQKSLETSLNTIMAPAIKSLVSNANEGSQQALEQLIRQFMGGMGQEGENQKKMLENASQEVNKAMSNMGKNMQEFLTEIEKQNGENVENQKSINTEFEELLKSIQTMQSESREAEDKRTDSLFSRVEESNHAGRIAIQNAAEVASTTINDVINGVQSQIESLGKRDEARNEAFNNQLEDFQKATNEMLSTHKSAINSQLEISENLLNQSSMLQEDVEKMTDSNKEIVEKLDHASGNLSNATSDLTSLGENIRTASVSLSGSISAAMEAAKHVTENNSEAINQIDSLSELFENASNRLVEVSTDLKSAAEFANNGFITMKDHQQEFQNALQNQVVELENQVRDILLDYAERVQTQTNGRMNDWTDQTNKYTSTMTDAINALAGVVDEIETKTNNRN